MTELTPAVLAALRGVTGTRSISYRFERIPKTGMPDQAVDGILSASVEYNALADIKRTAKLTVHEAASFDYLSDRIRPWAALALPGGEVAEWPLGVFVMTTPTRSYTEAEYTVRDVECYDLLQVLGDDKIETRLTFLKNTLYTTAITSVLLGIAPTVITPSTLRMSSDVEFSPGTSKLEIVNAFLDSINYAAAHFDAMGNFVAKPYVAPADADPLYEYATDEFSVITPGIEQTFDLFSIPNRWVLVKSDPDGPELVGTYQNDNPASPTSTVSRGRVITDFRTEQDAPDEITLYAKAERLAFEASQVFEIVEFETAAMPFHGHADVLALAMPEIDVAAKYSEHTWSLDLAPGAKMKHRARRVVAV